MADFAEFGEIVSRCIGYAENEFVEAYFENIIQNEEIIESSIVAKILLQFLEDMDSWEGTASELYQILTPIANGSGFSNNKLWPTAPNSLSRKLNELSPTLKEKGVEIVREYNAKNRERVIKIIKSGIISIISSYCSSLSVLLRNNHYLLIYQNHNFIQYYDDTTVTTIFFQYFCLSIWPLAIVCNICKIDLV